MDTEAGQDAALRQLRRLREGAGLTAARLSQAGDVLSLLGTSDAEEGLQRLVSALGQLQQPEQAAALRVDLGLDLHELLARSPVDREQRWLGDRRSAYATVVGRDVKTLARWSDRALLELRAVLGQQSFNGHLYVVGRVEGGRLTHSSLIQQASDSDGPSTSQSWHFPNEGEELTPPYLVYAFPRDWKPATLTLTVIFDKQSVPQMVHGVVAKTTFDLSYGREHHTLTVQDDGQATICIRRPRRDRLYGIWWSIAQSGSLVE